MKKLLSLLVMTLVLGMAQAQDYNQENLEVLYLPDNQAKKAYNFKNLRLYPIKARGEFLAQSKHIGKYTPLRQALAEKKVSITERESAPSDLQQNIAIQRNNLDTSRRRNQRVEEVQEPQQEIQQIQQIQTGGATVNTLFIENISKDTIYLMAGEIVQGGKQDRVIAKDMVIPPNSGKIDLSVFCVEHGRWSYQANATDQDIAFNNYYGVASMNMRKVVDKKKNQKEVWSEVSRSNAKNEVESSTQAYTAQGKSKEFAEKQKAYMKHFQQLFENEKDVIGVVVVTGDRVVGCDMFASPDLFRAQFPSLLSSYVNEALTDGAPVSISDQSVKAYMNRLLSSSQEQNKLLEKEGKLFQNNGKKLHFSTYK